MTHRMLHRCLVLIGVGWVSGSALAQPFQLPTRNRALFDGAEEQFFVGTVRKPWISGTFGCTRSEGWQLHEGLDIGCLERDKRGEPTDPVLATADGTVVYVNRKSSLSNYGLYVVVRHEIESVEVYSLYAHLASVASGMAAGTRIRAGEPLGVMGRTANTRQSISKERAHVHFELNLLANDRFESWFRERYRGERNDHGRWNGRNLLGLDPRQILLTQEAMQEQFSLVQLLRSQTELMRVRVRQTEFPFVRRYPQLIRSNPALGTNAIAGYEIVFNFSGVPFRLTPLAASDLPGKARVELVSVNAEEQRLRPCGRLVTRQGDGWRLTSTGEQSVALLLH